MTRMGMDPDLVENIGNRLKTQAGQIQQAIHDIDGLVNEAMAAWEGKDAQDFHGWWTQQHRGALTSAQHAIDGLGTSAINNAHEQRQVSGH
ncbi:WXG100 family type VII secretion target [Nocardioides kongjuensis]|uniref:Uncharacterized protein YukE n=1 Tax=Nocardioides kongjuensis TaxID=349522 RepID=A0A852RFB6_9ACTN|nr:WXG100 family type VII secretion target [Nocardioides kongjuensis]NYD33793.1 uncharacterized protein YukE [Nocardioides kongjuensis]